MQPEFAQVVEEFERHLCEHFSDRIVSAYLHGSIDKRDAISGLSDLDYFLLVSDVRAAEDENWIGEIIHQLQNRYHEINEIHLMVKPVAALADDPFTRFILSHNATLRMGISVGEIKEFETCIWYSPDSGIAKKRLAFARTCFGDALTGNKPACTGEIPENTYYAARKYARYFVVIEGAYFLMTRGAYNGFDKENVLASLREEAPQYSQQIEMTNTVLLDPIKADVTESVFLQQIQPMVEWMFDEIECS